MPLGLHTAALNFETTQEIGQEGRNSQVFLARDKQLDGEIVVKKIEKNKIVNPAEYYEEAKKLYASSHSNVVKVNYGCSDDDYIYIAMPYYKNGSLKSLIATKNLTIREIIRYSIQFLSGLHHIHSKGLIHFDVKPDNILISDSNEALLSDFGLAKAMDSFGFAKQDFLYSKQIAPEFNSLQKTLHYDIYLAGVTIYRLLNGENHFENQFAKYIVSQNLDKLAFIEDVQNGKFPNRSNYHPHIPLKLQRIVNKAMEVNTSDRYKNVLEFINELGCIEENLDWRFTQTPTTQCWERDNGTFTYKVSLDLSDTKNINIDTIRTNNTTNKASRINGCCHSNLNKNNYLSKVKDALKQ